MSAPTLSAFVQIQDAIVAAIAAVVGRYGVAVYPNRLRPIAVGKNAVVVRIDQSGAQDIVTQAQDWRTLYIVECYAHARPGTDPAREADVLLSIVQPALGSLDLSALGVTRLRAGDVRWQFDDANDAMVCALVGLEAEHRTPANSLQPWA